MAKVDNVPPPPVGNPWVTRIFTHGVRHVGNRDIKMRTILEVKGSNKTGKSLFLKLVRRCFVKLHDPSLIEDNYDEAVVGLEFQDESTPPVTYSITTTTTPSKTVRAIEASDGRVIEGPVETWLGRLSDTYFLDPLELLSTDRKEREAFLRAVLPVRFTGAEITSITGNPAVDGDMDYFDTVLAGAETERSKLNQTKEDIEGSIKRAAKGLLDSPDTTDYKQLQEQCEKELRALDADLRDVRSRLEIDRLGDVRDLDQQLSNAIEALRAQHKKDVEAVNSKARLALATAESDRQPIINAKSADLGQAKSKNEEQQRQAGLQAHLTGERLLLKETARKATAAQHVVEALRDLQSATWKTLPIPGVSYHGGDLFVDGKNIQTQVNTADVYKTMFSIVQHSVRAGQCPLLFTDRSESLDDQNRKWFYNAIREAGFQLIAEDVNRESLPLTLVAMD